MNGLNLLIFALLWFVVIPAATTVIVEDVTQEKIGAVFTAWIDRKFRGTMIAYLFRCRLCLAHWTIFAFAAMMTRVWMALPVEPVELKCLLVLASILGSIKITRIWLKE